MLAPLPWACSRTHRCPFSCGKVTSWWTVLGDVRHFATSPIHNAQAKDSMIQHQQNLLQWHASAPAKAGASFVFQPLHQCSEYSCTPTAPRT